MAFSPSTTSQINEDAAPDMFRRPLQTIPNDFDETSVGYMHHNQTSHTSPPTREPHKSIAAHEKGRSQSARSGISRGSVRTEFLSDIQKEMMNGNEQQNNNLSNDIRTKQTNAWEQDEQRFTSQSSHSNESGYRKSPTNVDNYDVHNPFEVTDATDAELSHTTTFSAAARNRRRRQLRKDARMSLGQAGYHVMSSSHSNLPTNKNLSQLNSGQGHPLQHGRVDPPLYSLNGAAQTNTAHAMQNQQPPYLHIPTDNMYASGYNATNLHNGSFPAQAYSTLLSPPVGQTVETKQPPGTGQTNNFTFNSSPNTDEQLWDSKNIAKLVYSMPERIMQNPQLFQPQIRPDPIGGIFPNSGTLPSSSSLLRDSGQSSNDSRISPAEETAMQALGLLVPGTPAYETQLQHVMKLTHLRFERELLEQEMQLERTRHKAMRERVEWQREFEHEQWVLAHQRQYKQQRILHAMEEALRMPVLHNSPAAVALSTAQAILGTDASGLPNHPHATQKQPNMSQDAYVEQKMDRSDVDNYDKLQMRMHQLRQEMQTLASPIANNLAPNISQSLNHALLEQRRQQMQPMNSFVSSGFQPSYTTRPEKTRPRHRNALQERVRRDPHRRTELQRPHKNTSITNTASTSRQQSTASSQMQDKTPSSFKRYHEFEAIQKGSAASSSSTTVRSETKDSADSSGHTSTRQSSPMSPESISKSTKHDSEATKSDTHSNNHPSAANSPSSTPSQGAKTQTAGSADFDSFPNRDRDQAVTEASTTTKKDDQDDTPQTSEKDRVLPDALPPQQEEDIEIEPAFLQNPLQPPPNVYLEPGDGFDIYVDGARFLPDNVSLTKVVIRALTEDFKPIGKTVESVARLDSEILSPEYNAYAAFRSQYTRNPRPSEYSKVARKRQEEAKAATKRSTALAAAVALSSSSLKIGIDSSTKKQNSDNKNADASSRTLDVNKDVENEQTASSHSSVSPNATREHNTDANPNQSSFSNPETIGTSPTNHISLSKVSQNTKYIDDEGMDSPRAEPPFDPTMTLVIRIDTLDTYTFEHQVAGYGLINLFCTPDATTNQEQPTYSDPDWRGVTLNAGTFQIPLFQAPPSKQQPLAANVLYSTAAKIPCASVLVRIVPVRRKQRLRGLLRGAIAAAAARNWASSKQLSQANESNKPATETHSDEEGENGVVNSTMELAPQKSKQPIEDESPQVAPTRKSVPREQWQSMGLYQPPPRYASGAYDSSRCRPAPAELMLFPKRADLASPTVRELLVEHFQKAQQSLREQQLQSAVGSKQNDLPMPEPEMSHGLEDIKNGEFGVPPAPSSPDTVLMRWLRMRMRGQPSIMMDYRYMIPFDLQLGIQVSVDAVHNVDKKTGMLVVFQCLTPMAPLYAKQPWISGVGMTSQRQWDSTQRHQSFMEQFVHYRDLPFDPKMSVLFDVRSVVLTKRSPKSLKKVAPSNEDISTSSDTNDIADMEDVILSKGGPFVDTFLPRKDQVNNDGDFVESPRAGQLTEALNKYTIELKPYGWTLLPVFDIRGEGYVQRGAFRLPLLKGSPPREVIVALRRGSGPKPSSTIPYPIEILQRALESSKMDPPQQYTDACSSLLVRLNDAQFDGVIRIGQTFYREDYMLDDKIKAKCRVPQDQVQRGGKALKRLLPKGESFSNFESVLNSLIAHSLRKFAIEKRGLVKVARETMQQTEQTTHADNETSTTTVNGPQT